MIPIVFLYIIVLMFIEMLIRSRRKFGFCHLNSKIGILSLQAQRSTRTGIFGITIFTLDDRTLEGMCIGLVRISSSEARL
jgi:hypothetical protein